MKLQVLMFLSFLLIVSLVAAQDEFGFNNPVLPILGDSINITFDTVNNTIFWDGNAFDPLRWLNIDGSNANQNINIFPYNLTAGFFFGDGSGLTNLNLAYFNPFDQSLNTTDNVTFVNLTANDLIIRNINGTNATFANLNVTENNSIYLGGVKLSTQETFEGKRVLSITDNETGDDVFVDAFAYLGSGFYLENISFENGTVIAKAFNASEAFYGGNFTGDNFTGTNAFFDFYDWTAESPWLIFNGSFLQFNETYFNESLEDIVANFTYDSLTLNGTTITDWSQVNFTVSNNTVFYTSPNFGGDFSVVLNETFNFEIAQIIVEPSTTSGNWRFAMYEYPSGEVIDADLIAHSDTWNIFKSYPINGQVSLNWTAVGPARSFNVTIKYFNNVAN